MKKNLIINTHGSVMLDHAVRALLEKVGKTFSSRAEYDVRSRPFIYADESNWLMHSKTSYDWPDSVHNSVMKFDAATEFGKLVELLEGKEQRVENITTDCSGILIHGTVEEDIVGPYLKLSHGKNVTGEKVKEIYNAMFGEEK